MDTVCSLLSSADKYIQYKCTNLLVQKVNTSQARSSLSASLLEVLLFIDSHGNSVLNLGSFTQLPHHVVSLILSREELRAEELYKFQAALIWSKKFSWSAKQPLLEVSVRSEASSVLIIDLQVLNPFLKFIKFHKIPAKILMSEIYPLGLVPHT